MSSLLDRMAAISLSSSVVSLPQPPLLQLQQFPALMPLERMAATSPLFSAVSPPPHQPPRPLQLPTPQLPLSAQLVTAQPIHQLQALTTKSSAMLITRITTTRSKRWRLLQVAYKSAMLTITTITTLAARQLSSYQAVKETPTIAI